MTETLSPTESVCPECLARIPAAQILRDGDVYLEKTCPQHGDFRTIIWRDADSFKNWVKPKLPSFPKNPTTEVKDGCPYLALERMPTVRGVHFQPISYFGRHPKALPKKCGLPSPK
jgi:uncharacterized radical SAM superfamily Fe-S cluster-containing enzyme